MLCARPSARGPRTLSQPSDTSSSRRTRTVRRSWRRSRSARSTDALVLLQSSPGRLHFFWRVQGFSAEGAELLQKHLARELGTDVAATSCSQTTRVAGYQNHKRERSHLITVTYRDADSRFTPDSFPPPPEATAGNRPSIPRTWHRDMDATERARLSLTKVPPAISGTAWRPPHLSRLRRIVRGLTLTMPEPYLRWPNGMPSACRRGVSASSSPRSPRPPELQVANRLEIYEAECARQIAPRR